MLWDGSGGTPPSYYEADGQVAEPWNGTPEENLQTFRAAAHFYGVAKIGVIELTENTKKLIGGEYARFEDVSEPYEDGRVKVIPNSYRWLLVYLVRQPVELNKRYPSFQAMSSSYGYMYGPIIQERLRRFIKSLGYHAVEANQSRAPMNVGAGALSGAGRAGVPLR